MTNPKKVWLRLICTIPDKPDKTAHKLFKRNMMEHARHTYIYYRLFYALDLELIVCIKMQPVDKWFRRVPIMKWF